MDPEREQQLAETLARHLDESTAGDGESELRDVFETLDEMDRILGSEDKVPASLSGHRVINEIGSGGMGVVYLARDERLSRDVAVKTLSPRYAGNPTLTARFLREARAMAQISHPNVARIYSLGAEGEPPHFVMEHLKGVPITAAAARLTFEQKAELMRKVTLAVAHLHEHGVIHRDLKPANILVDSDLEPKLLDFGLALETGLNDQRLSQAGEIIGTPHYLSPEQTHGAEMDRRTDIFSLGVILYELLTGSLPFEADSMRALMERIRGQDPELPTQRNASVPRGLQDICLKALEKELEHRYDSARRMAEDLERFLVGEAVHAQPRAYSRLIRDTIERHLNDIDAWRRDQIVTASEYDSLRRKYERLADREDTWILEARRLTLPQVTLYLGVWVLAVGVALLAFFRHPLLWPGAAAGLAAAVTGATFWAGVREWRSGRLRVGLAFLLASSALAPTALLVILHSLGFFSGFTRGREDLELFSALGLTKQTTNAQVFWSLVAALPVSLWLRRYTRASVFTLLFAATLASACVSGLLLAGLIEWVEKDPGRFYANLIPYAVLFLSAGFVVEKGRWFDDSRYLYPFGVVFTWAALTGLALFHEPYARWLRETFPWSRGQIEYLFILNAAIYLTLDLVCDRLSTPQMRATGKAFRFVIPGHVLTSLLLLGLAATERWQQSPESPAARWEARLFEWLLPGVAILFVFGSIPRQMKNFFATGLLFVGIGLVRLQKDYFQDRAILPVALLVAGIVLMAGAANYAPLRLGLQRLLVGLREKV
jgi:serine/threonine protein kinase